MTLENKVLSTVTLMREYGFLIILATMFSVGCYSKVARKNRPDDVKKASDFISEYYTAIKSHNFQECVEMFDSTKQVKNSKDSTFSSILLIENHQGGYLSHEIILTQTSVVILNGHEIGDYNIVCNVRRDSGMTKEEFTVKYEGESEPKIWSMNITTTLR